MLSLLEWPRLARLVRGQCLSLRERDFMLAAAVLGLSARRRLSGHLLPEYHSDSGGDGDHGRRRRHLSVNPR